MSIGSGTRQEKARIKRALGYELFLGAGGGAFGGVAGRWLVVSLLTPSFTGYPD